MPTTPDATTTNPHPDVPLPAGAVFGDVWEGADPERVVTGPERCVSGTDIAIWAGLRRGA